MSERDIKVTDIPFDTRAKLHLPAMDVSLQVNLSGTSRAVEAAVHAALFGQSTYENRDGGLVYALVKNECDTWFEANKAEIAEAVKAYLKANGDGIKAALRERMQNDAIDKLFASIIASKAG